MPRYVLVAMNGPTPEGSEEELERWYRDVHMPDLKSVTRFKSARYKTFRGKIPGVELLPGLRPLTLRAYIRSANCRGRLSRERRSGISRKARPRVPVHKTFLANAGYAEAVRWVEANSETVGEGYR